MLHRLLLPLLAALLLTACASTSGSRNKLESTLYTYQSTIRWGTPAEAAAFLHPDERDKLTPGSVAMKRMQQLQVTGYYVKGKSEPEPGEVRQTVEIRLVNRHTQVERSVTDLQVWKWDSERDAWWLVSGLPDYSPN